MIEQDKDVFLKSDPSVMADVSSSSPISRTAVSQIARTIRRKRNDLVVTGLKLRTVIDKILPQFPKINKIIPTYFNKFEVSYDTYFIAVSFEDAFVIVEFIILNDVPLVVLLISY